MQLSIFASDLFLCLVSLTMAIRLNRFSSIQAWLGTYAFGIIGVSAGFGCIHFLGFLTLDPLYRFFVDLSSYVGVAFIGIAYYQILMANLTWRLVYLKVIVLGLIYLVFGFYISFPLLPTVLGGISMVIVMFVSLIKMKHDRTAAILGFTGALLFILSGLVIGTKGSSGPFLNVDLFHIGLAIANFCLGTSIFRMK